MFVSREPLLKKEYIIGEGNHIREDVQRYLVFHANSAANWLADNRVKYIQEVQQWPF